MKKSDGFSFDDWFYNLQIHVLDRTGVDFSDCDSVLQDYDDDKDMHDVADEIAAEYGEDE